MSYLGILSVWGGIHGKLGGFEMKKEKKSRMFCQQPLGNRAF